MMSGEGVRRVEEMANLREKNGPVITRSLDLDLDLDLDHVILRGRAGMVVSAKSSRGGFNRRSSLFSKYSKFSKHI
jgi:hypothetical protein